MERFPGVYRGIVVARSSSRRGILKIFVPGVYDDEFRSSPDKLPDAEQASPLFGGVSGGSGMFSYPHIGAILWVLFQNGDQNYPVYFASCMGGSKNGGQFAKSEPLPDNPNGAYVHTIAIGNSTIVFSELGDIKIETRHNNSNGEPKASLIHINQDGVIEITASNTVSVETNELNLTAKTKMSLKSPRININTKALPNGGNGVIIDTDQLDMKVPDGQITTITKYNGAKTI